VSIEPSPVVLAVDKGRCLLGHSPHCIKGKPLKMLQGPETDCALLESSIVNAGIYLAAIQFQVVLYEKSGRSKLMVASCCPYKFEGNACCRLTLAFSACVTLAALDHETSCWALAEAQPPHLVEAVSKRFKDEFWRTEPETIGRSLPESMPWIDKPARLRALLRSAAEGCRAHDTTATLAPSSPPSLAMHQAMEISCVPVVSAPNSRIEHILVRFSHTAPARDQPSRRGDTPPRHSAEIAAPPPSLLLPSPPSPASRPTRSASPSSPRAVARRAAAARRSAAATAARRAAEAAAAVADESDDSGYSAPCDSSTDD
jgi:hypothetical protein